MSLDARLRKLNTVLSAKERAILVLGSLKAGTPEDPVWRQTMPQEQVREFNRLIGLMNACNLRLPLYITVIEQMTQQMFTRLHWLLTLSGYGVALWDLAGLVPASRRKKADQIVAGLLPVAEMPWDSGDKQHSFLEAADRMEAGLREGVQSYWQELRAVETIVDEIATEFDGEDPLRPVLRVVVERTRADLTMLRDFLSARVELELSEPDTETVEQLRVWMAKGQRLSG